MIPPPGLARALACPPTRLSHPQASTAKLACNPTHINTTHINIIRFTFNPVNPAGKYAKPGTYKQFGPRGRGVYWPRMPCLRCGCPWWLGEDWDAECIRWGSGVWVSGVCGLSSCGLAACGSPG